MKQRMTAPKHLASRSKMPISDASLVADNRVGAAATPRPGVNPVALAPTGIHEVQKPSTPAPNPTAAAAARLLLGEQAKLLPAAISLNSCQRERPWTTSLSRAHAHFGSRKASCTP